MIELLLQAEGALSLGLLDRAETLYRQVAGADPRNAIAVVGLARVALERGGESEALQLARQAQAIDPENSAAQRMVQRLEEVLTYRGVDLPVAHATPEPRLAPAIEPEPRPQREPEPQAQREPEPEPAEATASPLAAPSASPARRRSLVDRLLRRG